MNWIEFSADGVAVKPLRLNPEVLQALDQNLLLFFTGASRNASKILQKQTESSQKKDPIVIEALHQVKDMAYEVLRSLKGGNLRAFGDLLHENWEQKKRFAKGVSNPMIDEAYGLARQKGAIGGKITGAGGGGFLMLYVEPPAHKAVTITLEEKGLKRMDYHFEHMGAQVLMNTGLTIPKTTLRST